MYNILIRILGRIIIILCTLFSIIFNRKFNIHPCAPIKSISDKKTENYFDSYNPVIILYLHSLMLINEFNRL